MMVHRLTATLMRPLAGEQLSDAGGLQDKRAHLTPLQASVLAEIMITFATKAKSKPPRGGAAVAAKGISDGFCSTVSEVAVGGAALQQVDRR